MGGVHYLVKTGIHPEYGAFAPGKLLRAFMLEQAFAESVETYDFVGDADPWKLEWTRTTRNIVTVEAFSGGPRGYLAEASYLAERAGRGSGRRFRRLVSRSTGGGSGR